MGKDSAIEWTDHTFNAWEGCEKVSPACKNCYAETRAIRWGHSAGGKHLPLWGPGSIRKWRSDAYWRAPLKWNREAAGAAVRQGAKDFGEGAVGAGEHGLERGRQLLIEEKLGVGFAVAERGDGLGQRFGLGLVHEPHDFGFGLAAREHRRGADPVVAQHAKQFPEPLDLDRDQPAHHLDRRVAPGDARAAGGGQGDNQKVGSGFGGGGGGGATIEPAAFIIIDEDGYKLLPAKRGGWGDLIDAIPGIAKKLGKLKDTFMSSDDDDDESGDDKDVKPEADAGDS